MANNVPFGQGLTDTARKAWGFPGTAVEETKAEVKEVVVNESIQSNPGAYNVEVDSPKEFWDVLGHVKLSFYADGVESVQEIIANTFELWKSLKETYAGEFEAVKAEAEKPSKAQLNLLSQLGATTVPADLTKEAASRMIEELKGQQHHAPAGQPRADEYVAPRPTPPQGGGYGSTQNGPKLLSEKQLELIRKLAKPVPAGVEGWTSPQASDLIKQLLGR